MVALASTVVACSNHHAPTGNHEKVLGWVNATPIHSRVVAQIAQEHSLSQKQALALAADTLRLYFAYQERASAPALSPDLKHFLETQRAVRIWLQERFEPAHTAETVPKGMIETALAKSKGQAEPFRPRLHGICQVIVKPDPESSEQDARTISGFETKARKTLAPLYAAVQSAVSDLKKIDNCTLFESMVAVMSDKVPAGLHVNRETMILDLSQPQWDADFVAKVQPLKGPGFVAPFMTRFGLHLVYVARLFPAHLPAQADGSVSPSTKKKRVAFLRKKLVLPWRKKALATLLEDLRKNVPIRWEGRLP